MKKSRSNSANYLNSDTMRAHWVIIWDRACLYSFTVLVKATHAGQAEQNAIRLVNAENNYGPDEDGGFEAIAAFDHAELLAIAAELKAFGKGGLRPA